MSLGAGNKNSINIVRKIPDLYFMVKKCCSNIGFCSNTSSRWVSIGCTGTEMFPVTVTEMTLKEKKIQQKYLFQQWPVVFLVFLILGMHSRSSEMHVLSVYVL